MPGAVEKSPAWLKGAPFDVAKFFEMPPAAQNAAPLYLDAFCEFGTELAPIFPPEVRKRSAAILQRARQARAVYEAWAKDPEKADRASIDAFLAEYKDGFRKLDLAQRRPRCVFATGFSIDSPLTHAQVARNVVRVLLMRANRALDRDEFDSAIGDLGKIFRISRDLRPRGSPICQLVSMAFDMFACNQGITPVLAHRKLRVEHCDRLLKLLADHEAQAVEPFAEGIKQEYIAIRSILRLFAEGYKTALDADGRVVETKLDRAGVARELGLLMAQIVQNDSNPKPLDNPSTAEKLGELVDQFVRQAEQYRRSADDYSRSLLAAKPSYPDRARVLDSLDSIHLKKEGPTLFKLIASDNKPFLIAWGRDRTYLGATRCLIALKRWQLTNKTAPTDLAEVCRAARMPGVPVDPFSGSSLKLAMIEGEPVIYSVGTDGLDDRGLKDAEQGRKPEGDFLFRLPKRK